MAEIDCLWAVVAHLQLHGVVTDALNEGWDCHVILACLLPLRVALLQHFLQLLFFPLAPCKPTQSQHGEHMKQHLWSEGFLAPVADRASYSIFTKHQAVQFSKYVQRCTE